MKFNKKLIELRKRKGLSQEELGNKLNVTRQTVSKWELGQTTPEMEKLSEISRLFNISVDQLISESEDGFEQKTTIEDRPIKETTDNKNRKIVIIILAILAVVIILVILEIVTALNIFKGIVKDATNQSGEIINEFTDMAKDLAEEQDEEYEKDSEDMKELYNELVDSMSEDNLVSSKSFNSPFEIYNGTTNGTFLKRLIDKLVTNNKSSDRMITVVYEGTETQDANIIKDLKKSFNDTDEYEVTFDYDEEKFINKVTIENL